ncbi:PleD family two-component system response regulator [Methylopila musalis]|uniref:diguanylate cyclase n=1 Tax=Methylopila musalis TaxID=1134781 RepID=A0ABW3Z4V0_9HYPH
MTARVLVVDDVPSNLRLLEARLTAEYFDVITATSGQEALDICARAQCDIVLLDVIMPGMDGLETCRRLKADPRTHHIPVVMVTALDQPGDRVRGLEAGADDFLLKPVADVALFARLRSLTRLKMMSDELRLRARATREVRVSDALAAAMADDGYGGRILMVDDRDGDLDAVASALSARHEVTLERCPHEALFRAADGAFDLMIVALELKDSDALRLCAQTRSLERTRALPILLIADADATPRVLRGLEVGVNDYVTRPVDLNELMARARTQVRRKRYADHLRADLQTTAEQAITDDLTGLHNRRHFDARLPILLEEAASRHEPLSVLMIDIDFFKAINDQHGHDAGDAVLREFARRLKACMRGGDLICRLGGEEFVAAMPDTDGEVAKLVAERVRACIAATPIRVGGAGVIEAAITASIGVASVGPGADGAETLLKRADLALYEAKRLGRNRVAAAA